MNFLPFPGRRTCWEGRTKLGPDVTLNSKKGLAIFFSFKFFLLGATVFEGLKRIGWQWAMGLSSPTVSIFARGVAFILEMILENSVCSCHFYNRGDGRNRSREKLPFSTVFLLSRTFFAKIERTKMRRKTRVPTIVKGIVRSVFY